MEQVRQRAAVYTRGTVFLAYPEVRTEAGFFLASEPYMLISRLEPAEIGHAVSAALETSDTEVATPKRAEWRERNAARFRAARVKSESAFMRGARLVTLERKGGAIELMPHQNGGGVGAERGFTELPGHALRLNGKTDHATLGLACLQALHQCR
jgi:hypothetical protein